MARDISTASLEKYRRKAARYDATSVRTGLLRVRTVALLELASGDVVVDAGCGTGLSFPLLVAGVGPTGRVIGVDQSPEMAALARKRVADAGWSNVTVLEGRLEAIELPARFDAILFNYTHDIARSEIAVANLFRHARPGARVAMAGMKFFPWWTGPLNLYAYLKNLAWNGAANGMWRPWDIVERYTAGLHIRSTQFGMGYIGAGRHQGDPTTHGADPGAPDARHGERG